MTKRNIRTPEQIILDTEAKLAKLREKQARAEAMKNPAIAAVLAEKAEVQKEMRNAKKILGDGPQSANARRAKHLAWIDRIEQERQEADDFLGTYDQRMGEIQRRINNILDNPGTSIEAAN